jgi:hypothetical protein
MNSYYGSDELINPNDWSYSSFRNSGHLQPNHIYSMLEEIGESV